ncbi:MAG: GH43 / GH43_30 / GH43_32 / GH43_3 / GH43_33 [uncultured Thermomicrobiales bacterium]|uniref:GH43 / GH43_30 / GH43_32 / GH43_3 / GH43_33 n=1 Tax=uncultured Thermomicrobiales bacterium TaxID=1645740 RepID=A0A6J4UHN2_9BACT|nr:MAG: GH43 / GH43_30 / GH43_32 / GH43_3 / GH43_33 [uncultured Thermomicrobiales bacterium]
MGTTTARSAQLRPLLPEDRDQGDPFLFAAPGDGSARYRYYVYTTGEESLDGAAFPVYGSDDLRTWAPLGSALQAGARTAHWAPCVRHVPELNRPYVMLYSRAVGLGPEGHVGHAIRRADSERPEGPFVDSGEILTPDLDFAIDPDVYRLADGRLRLAFAMDFVEDEPYGTGIVETGITDDLTAIEGERRLLARPATDWQVYDAARVMPWKTIPGVDWTTHTVRWSTVEAPVGGLVSPGGRRVYLYSGGCFYGFYAVGAVVDDGVSPQDVSDGQANFVIGPDPDRGVYAPGHCSWLRDVDGSDYLMLHARFGSPEAKRQMCLASLRWSGADLPVAVPIG